MKNTKQIIQPFMVLIVTSIIMAIVTSWSAPALSAVDHYEVRVDGLACPFCAYGLEKKLKKLPGASNVHIDLDAGRATFDVAGSVLMPEPVRSAVRDAGFTPREFTVTASGTVKGNGDSLRLDVGNGQSFVLHGDNALEKLREHVKNSPLEVVITGTASKSGSIWKLQIASVHHGHGA